VARLGWEARPHGVYLDLCAGTLDLAAELARRPDFRGTVLGADFAVPMLVRGRNKAARAVRWAPMPWRCRFPDAAFDGALVGFGSGTSRTWTPAWRSGAGVEAGARFVILEFATPRVAPLRACTCSTSATSCRPSAAWCRNIGTPIPTCQSRCSRFPSPRRWRAACPRPASRAWVRAADRGICAVHHGTR